MSRTYQNRNQENRPRIMNYVDTKDTIKSKNMEKALDLLEFHLYLRSKNLWTLQQQIKVIKKVDKYVKKAIEKEDKDLLEICKLILSTHFANLLLDRSKLNKTGKNPFTLFLKNCEDTKIQDSNLGVNYINFLISEDDGYIHHSILEKVKDNCQNSMFKLNVQDEQDKDDEDKDDEDKDDEDKDEEDDEEDNKDEDDKEKEREKEQEKEQEKRALRMIEETSPRTQRRIQRLLRRNQTDFIY